MTARERLLDWLDGAVLRTSRQQRLRRVAWCLALLAGIVAIHTTVKRLSGEPAVSVAVGVLLGLVAAGVVIGTAILLPRRPSTSSVVASVDSRAGLRDELISAQWFLREAAGGSDGFVDLHVAHAWEAVRGLDLPRLVPMRIPRNAVLVAVAAGCVAAAATLWPAPPGGSTADDGAGGGRLVRAGEAGRDGLRSADGIAGDVDRDARDPDRGEASARRDALWKQVESLARDLIGRPEGQTLAEAIAARDARAAAQALRAAKEAKADGAKADEAMPESPGEQMNETMARDILDRLSALMKEEAAAPRPPEAPRESESSTARLDRELRREDEDAQRAGRRESSPGEDYVNTSLRALSRSSTSGRDVVHGEADSTEGAGRASVSSGAMGRRINSSTAGSGEGDQPTGEGAPPPSDDQVLGARTQRLAVQLKAVQVKQADGDERRDEDLERTGTEESFYEATRAQAARVGMSAVRASAQGGGESVSGAEGSPIEFREAVRRYSLTRHRREPDPNAARGGR